MIVHSSILPGRVPFSGMICQSAWDKLWKITRTGTWSNSSNWQRYQENSVCFICLDRSWFDQGWINSCLSVIFITDSFRTWVDSFRIFTSDGEFQNILLVVYSFGTHRMPLIDSFKNFWLRTPQTVSECPILVKRQFQICWTNIHPWVWHVWHTLCERAFPLPWISIFATLQLGEAFFPNQTVKASEIRNYLGFGQHPYTRD